MYVLVAVLFLGDAYKINIAPVMFPDREACISAKVSTQERLMATRPTTDSYAITFCAEVPRGV